MEKKLKKTAASEFKGVAGIEYFNFEEDFIEKNIRCIPMIVRFNMDSAGIKLGLDEWSRLTTEERTELATRPCTNSREIKEYHDYLTLLVRNRMDKEATALTIDTHPGWADIDKLPGRLLDKLHEIGLSIPLRQWAGLTNLQRFALLKLCRPGHENKNFPKALAEFGLTSPISSASQN